MMARLGCSAVLSLCDSGCGKPSISAAMGGGADGGCRQSARAMCRIDVGIGQVRAGDTVESVVFVQCQFGVGGLHCGDVTERADNGQVVEAVAT